MPLSTWLVSIKKKGKCAFLYIARRPVLGTAQSVLHFAPGRPVHSNSTSISNGSIQLRCNYCAKTMSITRYSFIQLSELEQTKL